MSEQATTISVPGVKLAEFEALFGEFASTYLHQSDGRTHLAKYSELRATARVNWQSIKSKTEQGQDITEEVLLKLLPWTDNEANRQKGAWVTVTPAITGDLKSWFENAGWTKPDDWPEIAKAIVQFIDVCISNSSALAEACDRFAALPYSKGLQCGMLSPILNALDPDSFLILNRKSRVAINHFGGTAHGLQLAAYPAANATGRALVIELQPMIEKDAIGTVAEAARVEDLFDAFTHWLTSIKEYDFGSTAYWKIAPGEAARLWPECRDGDFICIGWDELGDISGFSYQEFADRRDELLPRHADWTKDGLEQVWTFAHIQEGDRVLANRGTTEVVGIGTVTGPYYYALDREYRHRLPVRWDDTATRALDRGGWRRTLMKLERRDFDEAVGAPVVSRDAEQPAFTREAFELLAGLSHDPTNAYYQSRKDEFVRHLEQPFRELLAELARNLPAHARQTLETTKHVISRIPKNDYGKGGAWDFYWGAFYPKGAGRTKSPQLFVWINRAVLGYGFYVGAYGQDYRSRLRRRARENAAAIDAALAEHLASASVTFGRAPHEAAESAAEGLAVKTLSLREWLDGVEIGDFRAAAEMPREEVLGIGRADLVARISKVFELLYPLIRLASEEADVAEILGGAAPPELEEIEMQPTYSLQDLGAETGLELELLETWVRAIERKGQAIVYGPPGTGKTYVAIRLAKHLVASGDGIVELVQFHPSYSYEDFIEGIRPQTRPDGGLTYDLIPGRFLDFCQRASGRKDCSVLVVDEINRATLSRVLGELMYLLEYRDHVNQIPLAGGRIFSIPENVRLIGTMNTADRSIALVDHALRRRFAFLALRPNYDVLLKYHAGRFPVEGLIEVLKDLNEAIGNPDYYVGITFFLDEKLNLDIASIWAMEIEPYIEEYFFDRPSEVDRFRWTQVKSRIGL